MTARHRKLAKRMRRAYARRMRIAVLRLFTIAAVPLLFALPFAANAQAAPVESISGPSLAASGLEIFSGKSAAKSTALSPGTGVSEVLRGNGSRIGYKVSHGNIVAETMRVRAGGQQLRVDSDFWLDSASGNLIFAQAVGSTDSISVYYRYLEGPAAAGTGGSMPGLQLNFGGSASLGLMYNSIAGDGSGLDTSLYGLQLGGKLGGGGIAQFSGLAYFSNTQASTNVVNSAAATAGAVKPPAGSKLGMNQLIAQNFAVNSGKLQFHADFQDVGKGFAGFQALKASSANNKSLLDQLTSLENEKGVKRLGFGLNLANDLKSKTPGGLALQFNRIEDGKGAIAQQSLGYASHGFRFNYSTLEVDSKFAAFKGLREADKTQWEREKGLKTSTLGIGLDLATNKKGVVTGGLDFSSQNYTDKTGSLSRELIRGNSGGLGFSVMDRRADAGFKRLGDLSDADKTALALDLYHEFDPLAKVEQVTAADRLQVLKEAGLSRNALRLDDSLGKTGQLSYSQMRITNNPAANPNVLAPVQDDSLQRDSFGLNTSQFTLNYTDRKTGAGFNRIGDLADVEKNNLALDTRRIFDPNAKIEQVTQKDRDQLVKESGIERTDLRGQFNFGKAAKFGAITFSQFRIADHTSKDPLSGPSDAIEGALLGYTGKTFQLSFSSKTIGNSFNRMADLSDLDRLQFGNARGLSQQALNGSWQVNKATKFTFGRLAVGGTTDAIAAAQADALKNNTDVGLAAKTAQSGLSRMNVALETTGLSLSAIQANTDRDFARSADLPLADADKHLIDSERGTKSSQYALHFARIKGMTLDGSFYNAADAEQNLDHKLEKINAQYIVNKKTNLSFKTDADLSTTDGKKTGTDHTVVTFNQEIGKGFLLNLLHDANAVYDKNTPTPQSAKTDSLHFETPKALPNNFNFDIKRLAYLDGRYENTTNLNLHAKPTSALTFNYTHQDIDRGQGTPDPNAPVTPAPVTPSTAVNAPSETTDALDAQWQATKQFAVVFGFSQKDTTDKKDGDTVSVGLKGDPVKNVTMTAKFDELHNDATNTKDVADFAFSNAKPFKIGCVQDLTITAKYASLNDQRKLQNETMTGRAAWKIWKNEFLLDYGGLTKQNGEITISRIYSFTTDPNPKKWFHGGFYYKARTMVDGTERLIRRFNADWRLDRSTTFAYTFGTLPEDDKGNILPQTKADVSLKHTIQRDLSLEAFYRSYNDNTLKKVTRSLGFGIDGKLNRTTKMAVAYSLDALGDSTNYDHSNHYHFLVDHQMDADHFLTLSTEIKSHDGKDLKDEVRANVDFRVIF